MLKFPVVSFIEVLLYMGFHDIENMSDIIISNRECTTCKASKTVKYRQKI